MVDRPEAESNEQRLDKWLTYARFAKTRTVAQGLVTGGKVRINREKVTDSARRVRIGDILTIRAARQVHVVRVIGISATRVSAPKTVELFERVAT
ncbi:MAG: S4 domain-containing protein [Pseudomonadota bacterium]